MNHTTRVVLRKDKKNSKGLCPVSVVVTINRKKTYISTGVRVPEDAWDGEKVKSSFLHSTLHNAKINRKKAEADGIVLKHEAMGEAITALSARRKITDPKPDFLKYAFARLETLRKQETDEPVTESTKKRWRNEMERLRTYTKGKLAFEDITHIFLNKYRAYVAEQVDGNSIRQAFIPIRRLFNVAISEGITTHYPFKGWKFPKEHEPETSYLTMDECLALVELLETGAMPDAVRNTLAHFLLECFSGIRNSDWHKLQTERLADNESMFLNTTKTGERIYIPLKEWPLLAKVIAYIKDNELVWKDTLQSANRHLKIIAGIAGIEKEMTTHVGRHSCAVQLMERGFSMEAVAAVLGVDEKTARRYAKVTRQKVKNESIRHGGL